MLLKFVGRCLGIFVLIVLFIFNIKRSKHPMHPPTSAPLKIIKLKTKTEIPVIIEYYPDTADIWCYKSDYDDALPRIESVTVPNDSIFFIETSCRPGLDSRQACAIESAVRANTHRRVIVLFAGPKRKRLLEKGYIGILKSKYSNLEAVRMHVDTFAKGTPLEEFMRDDKINGSFYRIIHTADAMRLVTLYKYGGMYLDLDVVTAKSYDGLSKNFIGRQDDYGDGEVNSAVVACENTGVGKRFLDNCLAKLKKKFDPTKWAENGPMLMKEALLKTCNVSSIYKFKAENCGFNIYNHTYFYPIIWQNWADYFIKDQSNWLKNFTAHSFHFWNNLSAETKISKTSLYAAIAKKYCPTIYGLMNEEFGN